MWVILWLVLCGFAAWAALALHFALAGPEWLGNLLAAAVVVAVLGALVLLPRRWGLLVGVLPSLAVLLWWLSLTPANDRAWEPEYARIATVQRDGDLVRIGNLRNFRSPAGQDPIPLYEDAAYRLDELSSLDMIVSHWTGDAIAHVFVSFGFRDGRHLAISVETRRRRGDPYSAFAGFFRRYEIFYVLADERDLIGVRTDVRRESVYLYPVVASPAERRALLETYLDRVQRLASRPEFYNTLANNCTTAIVATSAAAGADMPMSWKILVSGYADSYAYDIGRLDHAVPFAALKARSLIRRAPDAVIGPDFSAAIRAGQPSTGG